MQEKQL